MVDQACPFCGSAPKILENAYRDQLNPYNGEGEAGGLHDRATCSNIKCPMHDKSLPRVAWNRRVSTVVAPSCPDGQKMKIYIPHIRACIESLKKDPLSRVNTTTWSTLEGALEEVEAFSAIHDGYVLVPKELTSAMADAVYPLPDIEKVGYDEWQIVTEERAVLAGDYKAMIDAAPSAIRVIKAGR